MKEVNEESVTCGEGVEQKIIKKNNIKKYAVGFALLTMSLTALGCLPKIAVAYDDKIDHTEEICLITRLQFRNAGINHQIEAMKKDYLEKGIENPIITYGDFKEDQIDKITYIPVSTEKTGTPVGYKKIYDENGNIKYVFTEAKQVVEGGKTHYFLPSGYVLGTKEFDVPVGYKKVYDKNGILKYVVVVEAKQVVEDGKTNYVLPEGFVLFNSNNIAQSYATITNYVHEPYEGTGFCTRYMINYEDGSKEAMYDYLLARKK